MADKESYDQIMKKQDEILKKLDIILSQNGTDKIDDLINAFNESLPCSTRKKSKTIESSTSESKSLPLHTFKVQVLTAEMKNVEKMIQAQRIDYLKEINPKKRHHIFIGNKERQLALHWMERFWWITYNEWKETLVVNEKTYEVYRAQVECFPCKFCPTIKDWNTKTLGDRRTYLTHENSADHKHAVAFMDLKIKCDVVKIVDNEPKPDVPNKMITALVPKLPFQPKPEDKLAEMVSPVLALNAKRVLAVIKTFKHQIVQGISMRATEENFSINYDRYYDPDDHKMKVPNVQAAIIFQDFEIRQNKIFKNAKYAHYLSSGSLQKIKTIIAQECRAEIDEFLAGRPALSFTFDGSEQGRWLIAY